MATENVPRPVLPIVEQEATARSKPSIQSLFEQLGFRAWEGSSDFTETWESPTVLIQTGTMESSTSTGIFLTVPFSCRIDFGEPSLKIDDVEVTGFTA
jgi:hypothetical protein